MDFNIRFDDPDDPMTSSSIVIWTYQRLAMLDFTRRCFERRGDKKRADELRKYFKQMATDSIIAVRSLVPDEIAGEYALLQGTQYRRLDEKRREQRKKDHKLAKLEEEAKERKRKK